MPNLTSLLKWFIGVSILVALIFVVEALAGWKNTLIQWQRLPVSTLLSAFILFSLSHLVRALRIFDYLFARRGYYLPVAKISALHQFANNLLPMRLGELTFPLLVKRTFNTQFSDGLSQLVWLRLLDLLFMGFITAGVCYFILPFNLFLGISALGISLFILCAILFPLLVTNISLLQSFFTTLRNNMPKSKKKIMRLFAYTALAWTMKMTAIAFLVQGLSEVSLLTAIMGALGAEISSLLPVHGIGGSGSFEAAFVAGTSLTGEAIPNMLALAVNVHIFVLLSTSLVTLMLLPVSLKLRDRE